MQRFSLTVRDRLDAADAKVIECSRFLASRLSPTGRAAGQLSSFLRRDPRISRNRETVAPPSPSPRSGTHCGVRGTAILICGCAVSLAGCEDAAKPQEAVPETISELVLSNAETFPVAPGEDRSAFKLYSTLAGKMARMEQLLNAVDRFLGDVSFHDRLLADAREFHHLLVESRGLYPEKLRPEDKAGFDRTIDAAASTSERLMRAIRASDHEAAREALDELAKLRQRAHSKYSY